MRWPTSWSGRLRERPASDYDVRKAFPYLGYDQIEFSVPTRTEGDVYARYLVRVAGDAREREDLPAGDRSRITPNGAWASGRSEDYAAAEGSRLPKWKRSSSTS